MKTPVRPRYLPPPYQDAAESGRLILRDGTTAQIHPARPDDCEAMRAFFKRLSPESRHRRFFSASPPRPELLRRRQELDYRLESDLPGRCLHVMIENR
jgi:hypothetical protein